MAERRSLVAGRSPVVNGDLVHVVEHELDMNRIGSGRRPVYRRIERILRWLMPQTYGSSTPTRSVARALEEKFPSRDN